MIQKKSAAVMEDYEKLGLFYLGKIIEPSDAHSHDELLLYESKNFTTHALCVGMTGSGKTGLGITILEEAAIDKIPAIAIDPKGDLGNLLLAFPDLSAPEFRPWVDESEAEKKGMSVDQYATFTANMWKKGLEEWGEGAERVRNFRNSVDVTIYTPASNAGIPISILSSFAAPTKEQLQDSEFLRDKILSTTSSLLGLIGLDADPIKSKEHILISTIIQKAWQEGKNLDIASIIHEIQKPSFTKIGALDLDTFFPQKERMTLSINLNNLLAAPGFQAWMEGVPLNIDQLLYTNEGKPKLSVITIAHLSDNERMFFVTLLLNEIISWMRRQSGTSSLRALLYMDEIFGFFPPTAAPPSKLPMLTLLKQARAYGLGIVLATQNPVDIDYKGLGNCGTWFIGKLQTDRDKSRVIDGLQVASNGELDGSSLDKLLSQIAKRTFVMRSIYEKNPIIFQTRWTLSYLRGPLTLKQIASLKKEEDLPEIPIKTLKEEPATENKPHIPAAINEYYVVPISKPLHFEPRILGIAKLHYMDSKNKIDQWQDYYCMAKLDDEGDNALWDNSEDITALKNNLKKEYPPGSSFKELPDDLMREKSYDNFKKTLASSIYQNQTLEIYQIEQPKMVSKAGESQRDFLARVNLETHEKRDEAVNKLKEKYSTKITALNEKIRKAQGKVSQKQEKAGMQKIQTLISFGSAVLGAVFGRGVSKGTISQTGTSIKNATRIGKDAKDAAQAEEDLQNLQQQLQELQQQMNDEILKLSLNGSDLEVSTLSIRPRKSDITIEKIALVWFPV